MCGHANAMCGSDCVMDNDAWRCSGVVRLIFFIAVSLVLHSLVFVVPVSWQRISPLGSRVGGEQMFQIFLAPTPSAPASVAKMLSPGERGGNKTGLRLGGGAVGVPVVPVVVDASLVSEIAIEVDDPEANGFLILSLDVNTDGVVDASSIVYSELPEAVSQLIERQFAAAMYKPAAINGQRHRATLLFRVDVD